MKEQEIETTDEHRFTQMKNQKHEKLEQSGLSLL